jgi:DNA adenine methylase
MPERSAQTWRGRTPVAAPLPWFGGKAYYADWIIDVFPDHQTYIEPVGGMANVLLRKEKSPVEVFNDLDSRVVNFFRVLREPVLFAELQTRCALTPYSRADFTACGGSPDGDSPVEEAWKFFVVCRQARGGLGMSRSTSSAWAASTRPRRNLPEGVSKYLSAVDGLEDVATRFREVMIEHLPAIDVIDRYDFEDALFYCDPPYAPDSRFGGKANVYGVEMSESDHIALLTRLSKCRAKVLLSGYSSPLYHDILASWKYETRATTSHVANSGMPREEILWMNFDRPQGGQSSLFSL